MKVDELRKIIYEEVQKAIRVELRSMLTELEGEQPNSTVKGDSVIFKPLSQEKQTTGFSLEDILQETRKSMTREEYKNILGESFQKETNTVSESTSELPPFVRNAKAILDASISKDMERHHGI